MASTAEERFFRKVKFVDNWYEGTRCLEWIGCFNGQGYGRFAVVASKPQKWVGAHRWLYERWVGPIPEGMHLDHLCFHRACVNPAHLEPVTNLENNRRRIEAKDIPRPAIKRASELTGPRTHCRRGHELTPENALRDKNPWRRSPACRTCKYVADRRAREKRKAKRLAQQ